MGLLAFLLFSHPLLIVSLSWFWNTKKVYEQCDLYLAPSLIEGVRRGIFAGRDYQAKELIESLPSVMIPTKIIEKLQLAYYAFSSDDEDYSMSIFGSGMLFNHQNKKNLDYVWNSPPIKRDKIIHNIYSSPHTTFSDINYVTNSKIQLGEEFYSSYGDDAAWFQNRQMKTEGVVPHSSRHTLEQLQEYGHCLSNLYLNTSTISLAGRGVFSKRHYSIGDIVTISPVIILPRHKLEQESLDTSLLYNYCIISPDSDVALLPIGLGGMINHGGQHLSNLKIDWYDWQQMNLKKIKSLNENILNWNVKKLEECRFAPLDIQYIATKEIQKNDELLVDYGEEWEREWMKYFEKLQEWEENQRLKRQEREIERERAKEWQPNLKRMKIDEKESIILKPQFRHGITAPKNLFPSHFFSEKCIGVECDREMSRGKILSKENSISLSQIEIAENYFMNYSLGGSHATVPITGS